MKSPQTKPDSLAGQALPKSATGIKGLDEVIGGGLPRGRISLVCGGPGCGKTLMGIEFLVRGAQEFHEPGVFISFEETPEEITANVASLGIDLEALVRQKKIFVDYIYIERSEIEETGVYDLEGLFIRLEDAVRRVGARRVVLDTIETLFSGFQDEGILRAELRRLFRWLKDRHLTTLVTGERGEGMLTRYGLEEYVSDCVILLDHRVRDQIATRRLRVVKYRGSSHGNDEYPFLIDEAGLWVMPVTSSGLDYEAGTERISSGIPDLDEMFGGEGFFRGSSILVSGTAGTGKTSMAAQMVDAACRRGERCLFFAFEESASQIQRNIRSIGIELEQWVQAGLLKFMASRPSARGIEMHLLLMEKMIQEFKPDVVVIDPFTNLTTIGTNAEVHAMLIRVIDFLKQCRITTLFTSLTSGTRDEINSEVGISSLMDTWLLVRNLEANGERNRALYILKSRGMKHSNQVREFRFTDHGLQLVEVFIGPQGILTGSARLAQETQNQMENARRRAEIEKKKQGLEVKRRQLEEQIADLRAAFAAEEAELQEGLHAAEQYQQQLSSSREDQARRRAGRPDPSGDHNAPGSQED